MTKPASQKTHKHTHTGTGSGSAAIRRAVQATKCGMPRYTRELIASLREASARSSGLPTIDAAPRSTTTLSSFGGSPDAIDAIWIGHATVLLNLGGLTILTDPVFSHRIGMRLMGHTFGIRRVLPPALEVDHLPTIDVILLSHAHFDHLDRPSLERLTTGPGRGAVVITAKGTRGLIPSGFSQVVELGWDRRASIHPAGRGNVQVSAIRPMHWGARTVADRHRGYNAYIIESNNKRVFFAGDSALTDRFARLGQTDLSIFGIGAYDPWEHAHATPEQVWAMHVGMSAGERPGTLLPMHHSTFVLGKEPMDEPLRRLLIAAAAMEHRVVARTPGEWVRVEPDGDTGPERRPVPPIQDFGNGL